MRIWKILDADLFNKAAELVERIKSGSEANKQAFLKECPFEFKQYMSGGGFELCETYSGAVPLEVLETIPHGWKPFKDRPEILVPDGRTKEGRRIGNSLNPASVICLEVHDLLNLKEITGRFYTPTIYQTKDKSEIFLPLDDQFDLSDDSRLEEVTLSYANKQLKKEPSGV